MFDFITQYSDWGLLILRLGVAYVFWAHGLPKIKDVGKFAGFLQQLKVPAAGLMGWVVSLWETLGAVLLALGIFTPLVALGFVVVMLVAIRGVKIGMAKADFVGGWELEFILLVAALALVFTGAGALSLDAFFGI